ncbi:hypothetical protein LTR66_010992 [Elasticomyces elasticus]|nr:hypothetical protein LTR66_010992 [Elasticomyces elasticus]KAK5003115.1 hypothetical protein LTR28_010572 [Elasticomyces elasticus]
MPQPVPKRPVNLVPAKKGDIFSLGAITIRVMEDGSRTDNRIGAAEFLLPPKTPGPPPHWHEMHDETFLVTQGRLKFHNCIPSEGAESTDIVADEGDYVVVPTRAPHTFSNPYDEEAKVFITFTPAFYINYFKLLGSLAEEGKPVSKEANINAMLNYATIPLARYEVQVPQ